MNFTSHICKRYREWARGTYILRPDNCYKKFSSEWAKSRCANTQRRACCTLTNSYEPHPERYWQEKTTDVGEELPQCNCYCDRSQICWPGITRKERWFINLLSLGKFFCKLLSFGDVKRYCINRFLYLLTLVMEIWEIVKDIRHHVSGFLHII